MMTVRLDQATRDWMDKRRYSGAERTVVMCWACGLYYMPELGHTCKAGANSAAQKAVEEQDDAGVIDMTGQRIGMLTAIRKVQRPEDGAITNSAWWLCRCDCGKETVVPRRYLTDSRYEHSCGCTKAKPETAPKIRGGKIGKMNVRLTENEKVDLGTLDGVPKMCPICKKQFEVLSRQWAYKRVTSDRAGRQKTDYYCSWRCLRQVG